MNSFPDLVKNIYHTALLSNPFPYQEKVASKKWPEVLEIPTGLGKTASVVLGWIAKRLREDQDTPRRLIYVLPMRVLVEQTFQEIEKWIRRLETAGLLETPRIRVYRLLGGNSDKEWDFYPEEESILVGTQDQMLSRALNRGYGMSKFRWPVHFSLLNNDSLWIMDEVQLMGTGLTTTAQLEAFRRSIGTFFPCKSLWMSATFHEQWLETVDFKAYMQKPTTYTLSQEDQQFDSASKRLNAKKTLYRFQGNSAKQENVAAFAIENHLPRSRTLIVLNRVRETQKMYEALKKILAKKGGVNPKLCLLHSRFRPEDRHKNLQTFLAPPEENGTICVSSQVVEAGVDVSCDLLITDLAPWASLVQRFGRANRYGESQNTKIFWLDPKEKKGWASPYEEDSLRKAREILLDLEGKNVGPGNLPKVTEPLGEESVLRKKDLYELFDTTPDLSGFDVDVSRFIRENDDLGVSVFWRDFTEKEGPPKNGPSPEELCSAPRQDLYSWLKKEKKPLFLWDHLEKKWVRPNSIFPGSLVLLPRNEGGYHAEMGWTGQKKDLPEPVPPRENISLEADGDEPLTETSTEKDLVTHTNEVLEELETILKNLDENMQLLTPKIHEALKNGARWHDAGKSHPVFQHFLEHSGEEFAQVILAKGKKSSNTFERKGFRHELASSLAFLQNVTTEEEGNIAYSRLAAYIIAAHHGKIRLSLRSMPHETYPPKEGTRFARGIWEGDKLPQADLGGGNVLPETDLDLSLMEFGTGPRGESWTQGVLRLLHHEDLGPFRLAYLESLLRIADWKASRKGGDPS